MLTPSKTLLPLALLAFCAGATPGAAQQPKSDAELGIQPRSDEAERQLENFKVPEGFRPMLWASEPDLANPVAFYIDYRGRVFVCETFRQEVDGVPDNRSHRYWLEDDLRLQTVEERGEMYLKYHPEYAEEWTDRNDRIRLLEDLDEDGKADRSVIFATGFGDLLDGTGAGVYVRGKEAWYTNIPKLWKLTDDNDDGRADRREALHHGYGVRVAFRGHDMHGLVLGPDGRLYFSIGDRGYNVVNQEGERLAAPNSGAVFRCELDGSNLEVFATGLRNPQELAFDDYGNLFTGDNNCDAGDQARLVYVMEGGDCGWSMNFQYLNDRGPWMSESWWKPRFDGQPAFLNPPIKNLGAGPSGFTHYPGFGLPEQYADSFFLVDFRGGAGGSGIWRFTLDPHGAGFEVDEQEQFWWKILATDVDFGPDGSLWASDWVQGWNGAGKGRMYRLDPPSGIDRNAMAANARLLAAEYDQMDGDRLLELLGHVDRRVRMEAQLELMARGEASVPGLISAARDRALPTLPRVHAIWALTRLGAGGVLAELLQDSDAEVRAQAARGVGDSGFDAAPALAEALQDPSARVRYFAAQSLGKVGGPDQVAALFALLAENNDTDRFLRHAASWALGGIGDLDQLTAASNHASPAVRLGAVLALRRMQHPSIARFLRDQDLFVATEAAIAIYDKPIDAALPALADVLGQKRSLPFAMARRAMHAANRLGGAARYAAVLDRFVLASGAESDRLRGEAANLIASWTAPQEFDRVRNESRVYGARDAEAAHAKLASSFAAMMAHPDAAVQQAAIRAARAAEMAEIAPELLTTVQGDGNEEVRIAALNTLSDFGAEQLGEGLRAAGQSDSAKLRARAMRLLAKWDPVEALPILADVLPRAEAAEQAAAFGALADLANPQADALLVAWVNRLGAGEVPGASQLELYEAATRRANEGSAGLAAALEAWRAGFDADDKLAPYRIALEGGDPQRGKDIFFNDPVASCQRCHYVHGDSSEEMPAEVGPALEGIGLARTREELLRSMVDPASEIAPGFEFYDADGKLLPISAMLPNLADTLGPRPLRDLVAYLDSKREPTRVMIFVHSAGYEHAVARADESGKSLLEKQWESWAAQDPRFEVIIDRNPAWFTRENLAKVDAVFFYTTGELPIPEEGKQALQAWVENGGGFSGAHCATDTYYEWEWYGNMIGGYFDGHPWNANATVGVTVEDPNHRACEHLGDKFTITDEIYQFKDPYSRERQHILLSLDTKASPMNVGGIKRTDGDFAIAWTRKQGKGRVFYSSLGHRADVWTHPAYAQHLIEGVLWAAGR
ncbi:MAG: glucose dehydrogenase [Planctomycetes bacterium]|nr:glucose dehydrogenase [Planctomycetota bacterium]